MLQIEETLISLDLLEKKFICDLGACKGGCCVEGDSGAPLDDDEIAQIESAYEPSKKYMTPEGIATIEKLGKWVIDMDGDKVTPLIDNKECAYTYINEQGITSCAIEKAWFNGEVAFRKPVSCHLYPVRVKVFRDFVGVNYDKNKLCKAARVMGEKHGIPVYKFLREPLIRKFGEDWYSQLCIAADELMDEQGQLKGNDTK